MQKYNTYSLEDSDRQRIDLHKNFRSRGEVLDSVNYIFRRIMKKEMGGIEYDDSAALYLGAKFRKQKKLRQKRYISSECERNTDLFKTELLILKDRDKEAENVRRSEARMMRAELKV